MVIDMEALQNAYNCYERWIKLGMSHYIAVSTASNEYQVKRSVLEKYILNH